MGRLPILACPGLPSRIPALVGLRGVARLSVVAWHATGGVIPFGWSGVDQFLVLSGFPPGGILVDHRGTPDRLRVVYPRRPCRVPPLHTPSATAPA